MPGRRRRQASTGRCDDNIGGSITRHRACSHIVSCCKEPHGPWLCYSLLVTRRGSTRESQNPMPFASLPTVSMYPDAAGRGGGSAPSNSSILTAPSRDGKLLELTCCFGRVVCSSFRARASAGEQTATAAGRCPFPVTMSAPRTRGSHDAARADGGVIPCLGLDSLWRILKKRRVDQYKRMQLNPEATFAAVTHLLCSRPPAVQPDGALGLFSLVFEKPTT